MKLPLKLILFICIVGLSVVLLQAQNDPPPLNSDCDPAILTQQQLALAEALQIDLEDDYEQSIANLFRLGTLYADIALRCGYEPNEVEVGGMIEQILSVTDVSTILAANAIGDDVEAILVELEDITGDLFNGQMLYNGLAEGLDGSSLGCSGCHSGQTAPPIEGTWTRITEEQLSDPALEGYTFEHYIVESIVHPNAYITPDYTENLMPDNYGTRMDIQQLADIIAYLESQDQLLEADDEAE